MLLIERLTALVQASDVAGIAYLESDGDLNTVSIITTPSVHLNRVEWVIGQQGNELIQGPEVVKLNVLGIYSSIFVPMREGLADNLGLKWGTTLILDTQNCTLWSGGNLDTAFP